MNSRNNRGMIRTLIRDVAIFVLNTPIIGDLLKLSDSIVIGSVAGAYSSQNYELCLQYALHGLTRKRKKISGHDRWIWWQYMKYGMESAYKTYTCVDYEKLRDLALSGPAPEEEREVGETLVKLSALGYACKDKEGAVSLIKLAGKTDKSWGEPDFLLGWFNLPGDESVHYFKQAIEKDSSYKSKILNNERCTKYPDIIAQLN
jgi:hypothetical protein